MSSTKYYIGNAFTNHELDLIKSALDNMQYLLYHEIDEHDEELKKNQLQHNKNCEEAGELIHKIKGLSSKNNKTELTFKLDQSLKKNEELKAELYHAKKEIEELKNKDYQEELSNVWQKYNELQEENDKLNKIVKDTNKGKNPLEDELKSIKQELENCKENLNFYKEKNIENKEKIAELEKPSNLNNEKYYLDFINSEYGNHSGWAEYCAKYPSNDKPAKKPVINNIKGSIVLPLTKYHENYDKKTYTFFITEDKLDCINKGLELLKKYNTWPLAIKTHDFINDRVKKIKSKVKSHLISMNGVDNPNLASELANY